MASGNGYQGFLRYGDSKAGKLLGDNGGGEIQPIIARYIERMFGSGAGEGICPGETNCQRFQSASGETLKAKEANACFGCALFPTKAPEAKKKRLYLENIVESAFRIRRERISGFPRSRHEITALQFYTLLRIENEIEARERFQQTQIFTMLSAMVKNGG